MAQQPKQKGDGQQQQRRDTLTFEQFAGVNTATTRAGVPDEQAYWLDGFMPLSQRNLRTLWDAGAALYSRPTNEIGSFGSITPGSGASGSGPFLDYTLLGGSGSGAAGNIYVQSGTVSSVALVSGGSGYAVNNSLSVAGIGGLTGFAVSVGSVISPTLVCFGFYNIGPTPYAVVFLSDGSAIQINTSTGVTAQILPFGTIQNPTITNIGLTQYGEQYLLVCANQTNGYWVWDGSVLYSAGSLAPEPLITNAGSGYSSPPTISVTGGQGTGAVLQATIANGVVNGLTVINAGHGWLATDSPVVTFSGGTSAGSGASLTAVMGHTTGGTGGNVTFTWTYTGTGHYYALTNININAGGSGYSPPPILTLSFGSTPTGAGWLDNAAPTISIGEIAGGLADPNISPNPANPSNWFNAPSGAFVTAVISDSGYYFVNSVTINSGGAGYGQPPLTSISVSGGSVIQTVLLTPTVLAGAIVNVTINNPGVYSAATQPTLTVNSSTSNATATVSLMPYGEQGTALQTYSGHVWLFNGSVFNFTAPGSVSNFATSAGGGSQKSNVSYLKVGYTNAISTNGFLFLIGDSSMDYVSGVQTTTPSGGSPTTTYTQNNSDPQQGTPYPYVVTPLGQNVVLANSTGMWVSAGGEFVKRSEALDGVWNSVPQFGGLQLSAAIATIFAKEVWMALVPIIDPVLGTAIQTSASVASVGSVISIGSGLPQSVVGQLAYDITNPNSIVTGTTVSSVASVSSALSHVYLSASVASVVSVGDQVAFFVQKLLMYRGNTWWASTQSVPLTFIGYQEINSVFTAWGTDGAKLYPLFQNPSMNFAKGWQTRYWDPQGYEYNDTTTRFWSLWQCFNAAGTNFTLNIDAVGIGTNGQYTNSQPYAITGPTSVGYFTTPPQAVGQQGVLMGMTCYTNAADMALISAKLLPDAYNYRG